jgi:hypothetical protein
MVEFKPGTKFQFIARDPWKRPNGTRGIEVSVLHCRVTKVNQRSIDFVIDRVSNREDIMPGSTGRWHPGDKWNFMLPFAETLIKKGAISGVNTEVN